VTRPERPVPPPLEGDDRLITAVITAGFAVALVVLLIVRDSLAPADRWWLWVAAFGTALGLFGLMYVPHLKRSRERTAARQQATRYHSATDITAADAGAGTGGVTTGHAVSDEASPDAKPAHPPR
jgi:Protein of unknown function (DUF2530)